MSRTPTLADVQNRRVQIAKIKADLDAEDRDLEFAEKVLLRLSLPQPNSVAPPPIPPPPVVLRRMGEPLPPVPPPPMARPAELPLDEEEESTLVENVKAKMTGKETLEELIELLFTECSDDWWTANEVQSHLTDVKGREVPMSSVSPTLTKLKDNGIIVREGHKVALKSRVQKNEAATG